MLPVLWRLGVRGLLLLCRSISLVTVQLPAPAAHIPAAPQLSRHTAAAGLGHRGRGHGAGGGQVTRVTIVTGHKSQAGSRWSRVTAAGHAAKVGAARAWPRDHWPRWPRYTGHMGPGLGRWRSNIRRGDGVCMFVTLARDRRMRRTATWLVVHRYHGAQPAPATGGEISVLTHIPGNQPPSTAQHCHTEH